MATQTEDAEALAIDTSKMSAGKRAAVEMAEAARERLEAQSSFAASLFMGDFVWDRIHPFPAPESAAAERGEAFLAELRDVMATVDADEVDRTGDLPDHLAGALRDIGAFGIKIPTRYGGLGHTQWTYTRAAMLVGSHCASSAAFISAHQSIGVPNPLLLFGTEEQKEEFLPKLAKGELSAFALTEVGAGSDPARMETTARPDGDDWVLNGTKLWCTNGSRAKWIVVMAQTPPKKVGDREIPQVTAFIVDAEAPGVEVEHLCQFMGHRAIGNVALRFNDVRVPSNHIVGGLGKGLRVALTTLNTGRLTLPAASTGVARRCLEIVRRWAGEREQWGAPIGRHPAVADKIARIAATAFGMEAMTMLTSGLVDRKAGDIRVEAAMCKLWCTERAWEVINHTMQTRGGRGYETPASLEARGESPDPVERYLRDARITTIFEGSSEILRCMAIAREGMDRHAKIAGDTLNTRADMGTRAAAALKSGLFYAPWYVSRWFPGAPGPMSGLHPDVAEHVQWGASAARRLSRRLFHQMVRHGLGLEQKQLLLGRFVDVATELFALSAACSYGQYQIDSGRKADEVVPLLDFLRQDVACRIDARYAEVGKNCDDAGERLSEQVLAGEFEWFELESLRPTAN